MLNLLCFISLHQYTNIFQVENSFFHIDSSHDLTITFQLRGFNPSSMKFPRAETFCETAKFSGTRFSLWETIVFDSKSSSGNF